VFKQVEKMNIKVDALVYLTDGEGDFPQHAPSYPVLWGNINKGKVYPWGETVDIPKVD
jgi:predicted metal-dependent peptidase